MNLSERDKKIIWHPYTQMQTAEPPVAIVRGEGAYLFDEKGKRYIDAISSWWVTLHGHAHPYIAEKVSEQLRILEQVIFAGFTHPKAIELAERLLQKLPTSQSKVFYSDNGSTAVEVALKMAFQYWHNQEVRKTKILAFKNAYHGDTFGAMSVSGRSAFTNPFLPLLFDVIFVDTPQKGQDEISLNQIKSVIEEQGEDIAAFIFEPIVQGAGGMLMYEAMKLEKLIRYFKEQHILTIADEVMTGFYRTGKFFATDAVNAKPDIYCLSKGLTGGTMALGVTTCTQEIYNAFLSEDKMKTLFHGHSFTANPLACSAALASLDLLELPETIENIKRIMHQHAVFGEQIKQHRMIKDVRQCGTILAIELQTEENSSYFNPARDKAYSFFLERGILLRPLGNVIYILPPYCIKKEDLEYIYASITDFYNSF